MSLIHRAVQRAGKRYDTVLLSDVEEGLGDQAKGRRPNSFQNDAETPPANEAAGERLRLDYAHLTRQGFVTPGSLASSMAREVSAAKRRLLRRINFFDRGGPQGDRRGENLILVTSAKPGEGKTFLSINFALSLALEEKLGVLLVDADLAAPRLSTIFRLDGQPGLSDRLRGSVHNLGTLLHRTDPVLLDVLPAGAGPDSPTELIGAPTLAATLRDAAVRYSDGLVIIDGPPVLATTEAPILAQQATHVVLVVAAGHSTQEDVALALELLGCDGKISLLLNQSQIRQAVQPSGLPYNGA